MAADLSLQFLLQGTGYLQAAGGGISIPKDSFTLGNNGFDVTVPLFSYGTANTYSSNTLLCNDLYSAELTIPASGSVNIDLSGNASYVNPFGVTLAFTKIKRVLVAVQSPDGVIKVRIGPNNVANAAQLWFGGAGAGMYVEECFTFLKDSPAAGWTITGGTGDLLPIANPGGADVNVAVLIAGVR